MDLHQPIFNFQNQFSVQCSPVWSVFFFFVLFFSFYNKVLLLMQDECPNKKFKASAKSKCFHCCRTIMTTGKRCEIHNLVNSYTVCHHNLNGWNFQHFDYHKMLKVWNVSETKKLVAWKMFWTYTDKSSHDWVLSVIWVSHNLSLMVPDKTGRSHSYV